MCNRVAFEDPFMLKYCPNKYKTQKMCNKAVDDCLSVLKFFSELFVTDKMIKKLHEALFTNDDIFFFDENFGKVALLGMK